jgi:hypothetical protein
MMRTASLLGPRNSAESFGVVSENMSAIMRSPVLDGTMG